MMNAYIKAISYYLPETIIDNATLAAQFPEWSVEKIAGKTGIDKRHIAAKDEFASDMAIAAAEKLFIEHNLSRHDIDFVLLCTQSPDYFLPTTACIVQHKLGIPTTAGAIDFNLGCSGYVYGLAIAKGLIASQVARNVLLITSEAYSKFMHPKDKSNRTIFGDASSATLVSSGNGICSIGNFELGTDGAGAENLIVKKGGLRYPISDTSDEDYYDEFGNVRNERNLYMNGSEIFNFTIDSVPGLVLATLNKNDINDINMVDLFVFHQANRYMLNHLRKKIGIPENKFPYYLANCGNTVSSTIPIVLKEMLDTGQIKQGNKLLLAGFGVGYSWGGCILHC